MIGVAKLEGFFRIEYMAGGIGFGVPGLSLVVVECLLFSFFHMGEPYSLACLVANYTYNVVLYKSKFFRLIFTSNSKKE